MRIFSAYNNSITIAIIGIVSNNYSYIEHQHLAFPESRAPVTRLRLRLRCACAFHEWPVMCAFE